MSWIQKLYETYEQCQGIVGDETGDNTVPLLPICHTTQKAHIEIVIDAKGIFKRARVVPIFDARTIIPSTEASAGRAGIKPECHPLCDKLQYIAADFSVMGGVVTKGFAKDPREPYHDYITILTSWCESPFGHPKAQAVLKYVLKERVVSDLIDSKILYAEKSKLLLTWEKSKDKQIPEIFTVIASQNDAFIRWVVESSGDLEPKAWRDRSLWKSWIEYYTSTKQERDLCYITGTEELIADQHPAKLRNDADKAKIISSNDTTKGFTFRGRILIADQACSVGFESSQKAHYALRWLISRQGYRPGEEVIVAWATNGVRVPHPMDDAFTLLGMEELQSDMPAEALTGQEFALRLRKRIAGYSREIGDTANIVIMSLGSATPGRMSIKYYRELTGSDFLMRINQWHETCRWIHRYRAAEYADDKGKTIRVHPPFIGAPSPKAIAEAAYGEKVDDTLKKATVERLLPCIIDGSPLPRDLVESVFRRACQRAGKEGWEWNKSLSIACAIYKKYKPKEDYDMACDMNRKTRDYLYGRLLAIAERIEEAALHKANEKRQTNAARYMQQFAEHPNKTWRQIYLSLSPYLVRLGGGSYYKSKIDEVMVLFQPEDFISDKALNGEFLIGYHCQRSSFWNKYEEEIQTVEITDTLTTN